VKINIREVEGVRWGGGGVEAAFQIGLKAWDPKLCGTSKTG